MKIKPFPKTLVRTVKYDRITQCPLCSGTSHLVAVLRRNFYKFGKIAIPLPDSKVGLRACGTCDLLFKDHIPTPASLIDIYTEVAENSWVTKEELHPRANDIQHYHKTGSLLDIGASSGDLLRDVRGSRLSAFDAIAYKACRARVTGEYIISQFEQTDCWSGDPYDVVSAFVSLSILWILEKLSITSQDF